MKLITKTLAIYILFSVWSYAQNCLPVEIVFSTQDQVDNFPNKYPYCTVIEGNLVITGSVNNLESLAQITEVEGSIIIFNVDLKSLNGMHNLTIIGGDLSIKNSIIEEYSGVFKPQVIGGKLIIEQSNVNTLKVGVKTTDDYNGKYISTELTDTNDDPSGDGIFGRKIVFRDLSATKAAINVSGRVTTKICIDRSGTVTLAELILSETTVTDRKTINLYLKAARGYKFQPDLKAPLVQCGKLSFKVGNTIYNQIR